MRQPPVMRDGLDHPTAADDEGWHGRLGSDWDEFGRPLRTRRRFAVERDDADGERAGDQVSTDYLLSTDAVWGDGAAASPPVIG